MSNLNWENMYDAPIMAVLTTLIFGCDTLENKPEHRPSAMSMQENGYVRYKNVQSSINQSVDQSRIIRI
jgi:hypothetical protein